MSKSQSIIILLCLAIMIGVGVDHVQAQARPKATAADVWAVTQEDDNTAHLTFLSTSGDTTTKIRAVVLNDRRLVKARVGEAPAAAKPRWIYVDNRDQNGALIGKTLVDLNVITKYDVPSGSSDLLLYEGGFVTVRTAATPEIKAFLAQHFAATDLSTQAVPAAEARTK